MYRLAVDGKRLHDTDFADFVVEKPLLKLAANKLTTLTFTIYPNNPVFDQIQKIRSVITVYRDRQIIAKVRPIKTKLNFRGGVDYTCEDLLGRLNDILCRPETFSGTQGEYLTAKLNAFMSQYTQSFSFEHLGSRVLRNGSQGSDVREMQSSLMRLGYSMGSYGADGIFGPVTQRAVEAFETTEGLTVNGVFDTTGDLAALEAHFTPEPVTDINPMTFFAGDVPHSGTESVDFENDEYIGYWDLLQKQIIEPYGGYLVPVWGSEDCAIRYVGDEDLYPAAQAIMFGENLADLFIDSDSAETFSVLIPLGKDTSKNRPLTIASVSVGGVDYLESEDGLSLYGRRERTMRWDDVSSASELLQKGQEYLDEHAVKLKEKLTLSSYDLHNANVQIDALNFMDSVKVISLRHSVAGTYPLAEMQLALNVPTASKLTLGSETETLTDRIGANRKTANGAYQALNGRIYDLEHPT